MTILVDRIGKYFDIPENEVEAAVSSGDYKVASKQEIAIQDYLKTNKGLFGALKVGAGQALDEALMGIPEMIVDNVADEDLIARKEALKKQFPIANALGGTAGFIASLGLGSPLFKAASAAGKSAGEAVTKIVPKAATLFGESTTGKLANRILTSDLVKAPIQYTTEGAIVSAPYAAAELFTGDPDAAAENLLVGSLGGGLIGMAGQVGKKIVGNVGVKNLTKKIARAWTGVPERDIEEYLLNADRINNAPDLESIKNMIDDEITRHDSSIINTKQSLRDAQTLAENNYRQKMFDLQRAEAPDSIVDDIQNILNTEKATLGKMSEDAYAILDKSPAKISTSRLKGFLTSAINDIVPSIEKEGKQVILGDKTLQAYNNLLSLRGSLDNLPSELSMPQLKSILKMIDPDISWNYSAGEFNVVTDKVKKAFRKNIDEKLKTLSPEYKAQMEKIATRSELINELSPQFGEATKARSILNNINNPEAQRKVAQLEKLASLQGSNLSDNLAEFKIAKGNLLKAKTQDIRNILIPEDLNKVSQLENQLKQLENTYEPIKRLNQNRTQNIIRNQGFKNASIEDRKALEALSALTGKDYTQLIRDRNVLESFMKKSTTGARKTLMGAVLGSLGGGPIGATIGAAGGFMFDDYGGQILKYILDRTPKFSGTFEEAVNKVSNLKADRGVGYSTSALERFLGEKKEDDQKSISALNNTINDLNGNPDLFNKFMTVHAMPLNFLNKDIDSAYKTKLASAINYVDSIMPRGSQKDVLAEYRPPSDKEIREFKAKMGIILDPMQAYNEVASGTITQGQINTLQTLYPKLYQKMSKDMLAYVSQNKNKLSVVQKNKVRQFLGMPTTTNAIMQNATQRTATQQQPQVQQRNTKPLNLDMANVSSDIERLENRRI